MRTVAATIANHRELKITHVVSFCYYIIMKNDIQEGRNIDTLPSVATVDGSGGRKSIRDLGRKAKSDDERCSVVSPF